MNIVKLVIECLRPSMKDHMNQGGSYWFDYENVLDACLMASNSDKNLIELINEIIQTEYSKSPACHAAVDIASTLENLAPKQFANSFVYF